MHHYYTYLLLSHSLPYLYGTTVQFLKREVTRLRLRRRGSFVDATWLTLALKPIWEKEGLKVLLGAPLAAAVIVGGSPENLAATQTMNWTVSQPVKNVLTVDLTPPDGVIRTTYQLPLTNLTGISQGFHAGHPGIDFTAPLKTPVVAMEEGTVASIAYERFGYGHNIVINHPKGVMTRYAHLTQIYVSPDKPVTAGQVIGTSGSTGWSTGPHLHFEIYENGEAVNPLIYVYKGLEIYQENVQKTKLAAN